MNIQVHIGPNIYICMYVYMYVCLFICKYIHTYDNIFVPFQNIQSKVDISRGNYYMPRGFCSTCNCKTRTHYPQHHHRHTHLQACSALYNLMFCTGDSFMASTRDNIVNSTVVFLDVLQIVIMACKITVIVHKMKQCYNCVPFNTKM